MTGAVTPLEVIKSDNCFITRDNFIAWLKTKPADEQYDYCDNVNCPFAQFLKANGIEVPIVYPDAWYSGGHWKTIRGRIPDWFYGPAIDVRHDNFGNLLKRIEAYGAGQ